MKLKLPGKKQWKKIGNVIGKAAEVAAPIVGSTVSPMIGTALGKGGDLLDKATEEKPEEEPKK